MDSRFAAIFLESHNFCFFTELQEECPGIPFILVGTKMDLRDDVGGMRPFRIGAERPVTAYAAVKAAIEIGACHYLECSARSQKGIKQVFQEVCGVAILKERGGVRKRKGIVGFIGKMIGKEYEAFGLEDYGKANLARLKQSVYKLAEEEIKHWKKELKRERKWQKTQAQEHWTAFRNLSRDTVLHLLREYHCVDLRNDCKEFQPKYSFYASEIGLSREKYFMNFFGFFRDDKGRQIHQLFFNFRVVSYPQREHLPLRKRMLDLAVMMGEMEHSIAYFENYYQNTTEAISVIRLENIFYPRDFGAWELSSTRNCREINLNFTNFSNGRFVPQDLGQCLLVIKKRYPKLQKLRIFRKKDWRPFIGREDYHMALPQLRKLVLHRLEFNHHLKFAKLPLLEELTIFVPEKRQTVQKISEVQMQTLGKLQNIQRLVFVRVDMVQATSICDLLFSPKMKDIVFYQCEYDMTSVNQHSEHLRDAVSLKLLVLHQTQPRKDGVALSEEFWQRVQEIATERKDFKYFLRADSNKKMTNMTEHRVFVGQYEKDLVLF